MYSFQETGVVSALRSNERFSCLIRMYLIFSLMFIALTTAPIDRTKTVELEKCERHFLVYQTFQNLASIKSIETI